MGSSARDGTSLGSIERGEQGLEGARETEHIPGTDPEISPNQSSLLLLTDLPVSEGDSVLSSGRILLCMGPSERA